MNTNEKIVNLLARRDLFAHEIKNILGISYKELWQCLKQLKAQGRIFQYFRDTPVSATICFCLPGNQKPTLNNNKGIKSWTPEQSKHSY